jgi:hypothetical protein
VSALEDKVQSLEQCRCSALDTKNYRLVGLRLASRLDMNIKACYRDGYIRENPEITYITTDGCLCGELDLKWFTIWSVDQIRKISQLGHECEANREIQEMK